jgi:hypothetical protein
MKRWKGHGVTLGALASLPALSVLAGAAFATGPAAPAAPAKPALGVVQGAKPLSQQQKAAADGKSCDPLYGRYAGSISNSRGTWNLYICQFRDGSRSSIWIPVL